MLAEHGYGGPPSHADRFTLLTVVPADARGGTHPAHDSTFMDEPD